MKLEMSFPREQNVAKQNKIPLIIAGGTVEYHGAHCAYGCDTLIVEGLIDLLSKEKEIITAPTIWYSPASYAVGDKTSGTVHVEEDVFENYVYYIFRSLLYSGYKNIYVVIHHQFEQESLMPMTLSYMKAAKKAIMRYVEETQGEGWWGSENYNNYYANLQTADNPFSWIKIIPAMTSEVQNETGYDHAGKFESSILMALNPEAVKKERVDEIPHWYTKSAKEANLQLGQKMVDLTLKSLKERII